MDLHPQSGVDRVHFGGLTLKGRDGPVDPSICFVVMTRFTISVYQIQMGRFDPLTLRKKPDVLLVDLSRLKILSQSDQGSALESETLAAVF